MSGMIIGNPITLGGGGKAKKLLSSLTEGSLISVLEDGKLVPFYVAKHDYESDLNGEGRTLLVRKDIHSNGVWNSANTNTLNGSTIDAWLNGDYFNTLSATVKSAIPATTIEYTPGTDVSEVVTTTAKNVFLLSFTEMGVVSGSLNVEGEELPIAGTLRVGYLNGVAAYQWTRSPCLGRSSVVGVSTSEVTADIGLAHATESWGRRPCFTLPATMALNAEPYADGSWGLADEDVLIDTTTATTVAKSGVTYTSGIADLTPAQLHEIAAAISANHNIDKYMGTIYYDNGNVHRKIMVGDQQNIDVNGVSYAVNIIGFNHDDLVLSTAYGKPTATGKAGISFQLSNCLATLYSMNDSNTNVGGWTSSVMRATHMATFFGQLSSDLLNAIKTVTKLTSAGNKSTTINTTEDKLFLLSEVEIYGVATYSAAGEGEQYAYYKAGNSPAKTIGGAVAWWWERSPYINNATTFCEVQDSGQYGWGSAGASTENGIAFAYCI